jgi:hypothetical protein
MCARICIFNGRKSISLSLSRPVRGFLAAARGAGFFALFFFLPFDDEGREALRFLATTALLL